MFYSLNMWMIDIVCSSNVSLLALYSIIPSFRYMDNSVYLHECSPFWVGIFITFNKEKYHIYCFM